MARGTKRADPESTAGVETPQPPATGRGRGSGGSTGRSSGGGKGTARSSGGSAARGRGSRGGRGKKAQVQQDQNQAQDVSASVLLSSRCM